MRGPIDLAVGYSRVSTVEQGESGLGLAAQEEAMRAECKRRDWRLLRICTDVASGKSTGHRANLKVALDLVRSGTAGTLIVAKLDRLTRSLADFAMLMDDAQTNGWNLVALDLGVDLSTPAGEFLANVMASAAQWERRIIGERTRVAMAEAKARGVQVGRRSNVPEHVREFVVTSRAAGIAYGQIAKELNSRGEPTAQGGKRWYPSTVRLIESPS